WRKQERQNRNHLDQNVQRRTGGILEWIAYGIADNGSLVSGRAFELALYQALLDELLGIVPGAAGVRHEHSEQHSHDGGTEKESAERLGSEHEPDDHR